jgi:hypothetical protein
MGSILPYCGPKSRRGQLFFGEKANGAGLSLGKRGPIVRRCSGFKGSTARQEVPGINFGQRPRGCRIIFGLLTFSDIVSSKSTDKEFPEGIFSDY